MANDGQDAWLWWSGGRHCVPCPTASCALLWAGATGIQLEEHFGAAQLSRERGCVHIRINHIHILDDDDR
jgi:hypothetical protein